MLRNLSETHKLSEKDAAIFCPYFAPYYREEEICNSGHHTGIENEKCIVDCHCC